MSRPCSPCSLSCLFVAPLTVYYCSGHYDTLQPLGTHNNHGPDWLCVELKVPFGSLHITELGRMPWGWGGVFLLLLLIGGMAYLGSAAALAHRRTAGQVDWRGGEWLPHRREWVEFAGLARDGRWHTKLLRKARYCVRRLQPARPKAVERDRGYFCRLERGRLHIDTSRRAASTSTLESFPDTTPHEVASR